VATGSMATRLARADIGDLMQQRGAFSASKAYAYSKHAMQALGFELDRRLRASHSGMRSLVVHPGFALDVQSPRREGINDLTTGARFSQTLLRPMTQGKNRGAWGTVRALVDPDAAGGTYFGPPGGLRGAPRPQRAVPQDTDPQFAAELWRLSEGWAQLEFQL
jgi:NAD(P)-dependent dehydrogenase (short-subunit alcohol dehydrogenase family)